MSQPAEVNVPTAQPEVAQPAAEFEAPEVPETQEMYEAPEEPEVTEVAETPEAVDPNRPKRRKKN